MSKWSLKGSTFSFFLILLLLVAFSHCIMHTYQHHCALYMGSTFARCRMSIVEKVRRRINNFRRQVASPAL